MDERRPAVDVGAQKVLGGQGGSYTSISTLSPVLAGNGGAGPSLSPLDELGWLPCCLPHRQVLSGEGQRSIYRFGV